MPARRCTVFVAPVAALVACLATPVAADDRLVGEPKVPPAMRLRISYTATTHVVCGTGSLRGLSNTGPSWRMETIGARSDGSLIRDTRIVNGPSFSYCYTVQKLGADRGDYVTTLTYVGNGDDRPSQIAAAGLWEPGHDNSVESEQ